MTTESTPSISLVDKTSESRSSFDENALSLAPTAAASSSGSKLRSKVTATRSERRYAKWQPDRLGISDDSNGDKKASKAGHLSLMNTSTNTNTLSESSSVPRIEIEQHDVEATDFASSAGQTNGGQVSAAEQQHRDSNDTSSISELDILYENQRGWFFLGIPLYSQKSLLNLDPSAWVTHDLKDSPVNITNAQLPDPSWEWAWKSWYVDMSGDVDEQGWKYSLSFSSKAWHGSHPWFHSFVRRRRWVRLRAKRSAERSYRGLSEFETSRMLNEDYFTIHSGQKKGRAASSAATSQRQSNRTTGKVEDEAPPLEEIANIPTLMYALKAAIVDREKIDVLKRFIEEGGDEIYYLNGKIPEIMSIFLFQDSRWQFLTHLLSVIKELSQRASEVDTKEAQELRRKQSNLTKAVESVRSHITGPELVDGHRESLDLTPLSKEENLMATLSGKASYKPMDNGGRIMGIPRQAEIGREGHIYRPAV